MGLLPPEPLGVRSWRSLVPGELSIQQAPARCLGPRGQARAACSAVRRRQDRLAPTGAELCPGTRAAKRFERRGAETVQVTASGRGSWTRRSLLMQCDRETPRSGPASATTTTTPAPMCKAGSLCSLSWREPVPQDWRSLGPGFASSWNLCARAFPKGKLDRFPGRWPPRPLREQAVPCTSEERPGGSMAE